MHGRDNVSEKTHTVFEKRHQPPRARGRVHLGRVEVGRLPRVVIWLGAHTVIRYQRSIRLPCAS